MRRHSVVKQALVGAVVAGVFGSPIVSVAAESPRASAEGFGGDVQLRDGGVFVGKLVDAHGAPLAGTDVALRYAGQRVAVAKSDQSGVFAVKGLRPGQYQVVAAGGMNTFRVWTPQTAPPGAINGALIITGPDVVNGQGGMLGFVQQYPLMTAAAVTAAIAIPVAIAASDDDDPPATP